MNKHRLVGARRARNSIMAYSRLASLFARAGARAAAHAAGLAGVIEDEMMIKM
jgi:hypothetical protein